MRKFLFLILSLIISNSVLFATENQLIWTIDNLTLIEGNTVVTYGSPKVISTELGNAIEFNSNAVTAPVSGAGDRIQIKANPLGTSTGEFTIEMIFKPYPTSVDFAPRVLHICRPDGMSGPRVMTMEIRSTSTWTTDFYIKSVTGSGVMGTTSYATGQWMHLAMTYKDGILKGYVNGNPDVSYTGSKYTGLPSTAEVSLGGRMNNVNYFKGAIRKLIFTPVALDPAQFTYDNFTAITPISNTKNILSQNQPNPFTDNTLISYSLTHSDQVLIEVFNYAGQKIQVLVDENKPEGKHDVNFKRNNLPSGIYFYTITTSSGFTETLKMNIQ